MRINGMKSFDVILATESQIVRKIQDVITKCEKRNDSKEEEEDVSILVNVAYLQEETVEAIRVVHPSISFYGERSAHREGEEKAKGRREMSELTNTTRLFIDVQKCRLSSDWTLIAHAPVQMICLDAEESSERQQKRDQLKSLEAFAAGGNGRVLGGGVGRGQGRGRGRGGSGIEGSSGTRGVGRGRGRGRGDSGNDAWMEVGDLRITN